MHTWIKFVQEAVALANESISVMSPMKRIDINILLPKLWTTSVTLQKKKNWKHVIAVDYSPLRTVASSTEDLIDRPLPSPVSRNLELTSVSESMTGLNALEFLRCNSDSNRIQSAGIRSWKMIYFLWFAVFIYW